MAIAIPPLVKALMWVLGGAALGPSVLKSGARGIKGVGREWGELLGLSEGTEGLAGEQEAENQKLLGMVMEKAKAGKEPELEPGMAQVLTLLNRVGAEQGVGAGGMGLEGEAGGAGELARILGGFAGEVSPDRVRRATGQMPRDAAMLAMMMGGGR